MAIDSYLFGYCRATLSFDDGCTALTWERLVPYTESGGGWSLGLMSEVRGLKVVGP